MVEKRKDKKGRLLRSGESQRKDGKYEYKYMDSDGRRRSVYSWKLVPTDKADGKAGLSLREKEETISKELVRGNNINKSQITLVECIEAYLELKKFANSTYENYLCYYKRCIKNSVIGKMSIRCIKKSDIKRFYAYYSKKGYADGTIQILHKIIHPALEMAVDDEVIGKNPSSGCCREYTMMKERVALSVEEQSIFFNDVIQYSGDSEKYYLIFMTMMGLACRVNELIGLTWKDVDMKLRIVTIDHGIVYRKKDGKFQFYATSGTAKNVKRKIPMTDVVYSCFNQLRKNRFKKPSKVEIDGYSDFVFTSASGTPINPLNLNKALSKMICKYKEKTNKDFPDISNHIFRHSGCTNMAESEVDPNSMMHIMGHRDLKMIMKVYDTVNFERVRKQMNKMN